MKTRFSALVLALLLVCGRAALCAEADPWKVDFRYAIPWWQTAICLPDDWQKTLVGKDGELLYDYPGKFSDFQTRITVSVAVRPRGTLDKGTVPVSSDETRDSPRETGDSPRWVKQELASPRVPLVRTLLGKGPIEITEEAFAVVPEAPVLATRQCQPPPASRFDVVLVRLRNTGGDSQVVTPLVTIQSQAKPHVLPKSSRAVAGNTRLVCSEPIERPQLGPGKDGSTLLLRLAPAALPAGGQSASR